MKQKNIFVVLTILISIAAFAQQQKAAKSPPLPTAVYNNLHDSCTSLDIVFLTGKGGSMSLEGRNVKFFTSFMQPRSVDKKPNAVQDGTIMWERNGREYLSGAMYFTSDSSGYIRFEKDSKEYVNVLTPQGAGFLQTHGK